MVTKKRRVDDEILTLTTSPARVSRGRLRKRILKIVGHPENRGTPTEWELWDTHPSRDIRGHSGTPTNRADIRGHPPTVPTGTRGNCGRPTNRIRGHPPIVMGILADIRKLWDTHQPGNSGTPMLAPVLLRNTWAEIMGHPPTDAHSWTPTNRAHGEGIKGHPPTGEFRDTHAGTRASPGHLGNRGTPTSRAHHGKGAGFGAGI